MDEILLGFENLKISAFSKYCQLTGDINNVTIGPNSSFMQKNDVEEDKTLPEPKKEKPTVETPPKHDSVPFNQVLKEFETQRREKLQEAIDDRYNRFENFAKTQKEQKQDQWLHKQQAFIQSMHENEQTILQTVDQTVNTSNQNEKLIKHYQDMMQRKMQYEQQLEKNKEKQRILNENIEKIKKCQIEFRPIYQEIFAAIKTCTSGEELRKLLGDNFKLLKTLPESFEEIVAKCKAYKIDDEQLLKAANILNQVKSLKIQVEEAVSKINSKKKEEQIKPPTPSVKENTVLVDSNQNQNNKSTISSLEQCVSLSNLKKYSEVKQFLAQHSELFKELVTDDRLKQFRFDCKKAVNIPVNAISAVNAEHLKEKYVKLSNLLTGKTVAVADKQINAARHPQGIFFCMDLLAKKFVLQGDLMISSNPEAAFCYATIIISLWNDFADFGKLLLGYFYTQCPYLVPFHIPKTEEQTNEDYYVSLGYHYVDGQIEKQDKFLKRMTGILRLYFAILIAKPRKGQTNNPHNIKNAWNFLASILKLDPQLDITATSLHIFLETVGYEMEAVYGIAFKKLVRIVMDKFLPALKKIDSGGPVTRLEVLLQNYKTKGHFDKPNGILPNNFW
ncbi:GLE1 domain containing protein [Asbolus verrucosus]|uniref:mRNA export factor GLE1 n=1 Tax=Asbolus verrucosus TaxID=1661398 RepID=A0A482W7S7_ASBVE|nr:GLE1 domain containing protein [Asbolus verrucosus]